jgi:hypothetical protein
VVAFSGFDYEGAGKALALMPRTGGARFGSFWSAGPGWGVFTIVSDGAARRTEIAVREGMLPLRSLRLRQASAGTTAVLLNGRACAHKAERKDGAVTLVLAEEIAVPAGGRLVVTG